MYDAVFRPDRPPPPPSPIPPLLPEDSGEREKEQGRVAANEVESSARRGDRGGGGAEAEAEAGVTPFLAAERLTLEEAVWIYTAGAAAAAGAEERFGAIRPGFSADLTVVEVPGGGERLLEDPRLGNSCTALYLCMQGNSLQQPWTSVHSVPHAV